MGEVLAMCLARRQAWQRLSLCLIFQPSAWLLRLLITGSAPAAWLPVAHAWRSSSHHPAGRQAIEQIGTVVTGLTTAPGWHVAPLGRGPQTYHCAASGTGLQYVSVGLACAGLGGDHVRAALPRQRRSASSTCGYGTAGLSQTATACTAAGAAGIDDRCGCKQSDCLRIQSCPIYADSRLAVVSNVSILVPSSSSQTVLDIRAHV